jgi:23S rRNA-/tRNA-specific pseudouridylate synthase
VSQRLIKEGHVQISGRPAKPNQPVKVGQRVSLAILDPVEGEPEPEELALPILYQDPRHCGGRANPQVWSSIRQQAMPARYL